MTLADAYATVQEYRDQTGKTSEDDDLALGRELKAIARYLDRALGRTLGFNRDGTGPTDDVARVYVMGRGVVLDIDDHVSITSIAIGDHYTQTYATALAASAWVKLPRKAASGPEAKPYRQLEFLSSYPGVGELVKVTGIGGWPAVPDAIKSANIELTSILRLESPRSSNSINEMNQVISTSRVAQNILGELIDAYRGISAVFA